METIEAKFNETYFRGRLCIFTKYWKLWSISYLKYKMSLSIEREFDSVSDNSSKNVVFSRKCHVSVTFGSTSRYVCPSHRMQTWRSKKLLDFKRHMIPLRD